MKSAITVLLMSELSGGRIQGKTRWSILHFPGRPIFHGSADSAQKFVYKSLHLKVEAGDCLLTLFGLKAPKGGIDSENQVKALFLPSQ
jgi:hypothetical protein